MAANLRRRTVVAGALPLLALLAGCGTDGGAAAPVSMGPPSADVRVGLLDYDFSRSASALLDGVVTFVVTNAGATAHDLKVLDGETVLGETRILQPGQEETITADVTGLSRVTFLCTVPGHRSMGMVQEVDVVAASSASPTSTPTALTDTSTKESRAA